MKKMKNDESYSCITKLIKYFETRYKEAKTFEEKQTVLIEYKHSILTKIFFFIPEDYTLFANILEDINLKRMEKSFYKLLHKLKESEEK